ncbi:MAG: glycoside hydrolase family 43 protein [Balneolaceae bacterium]
MKNRTNAILLLSGILLLIVPSFLNTAHSQDRDRFIPGEIWPDNNGVHINAHGGGFLHHEGTYYWFGEHKTDGSGGNRANVGVHVYSSEDLYNWTDEGIALAVETDTTSEVRAGSVIERPKVIYNPETEQFVMWFHLELYGQGYRAARTALAVSDHVTGPYEYIRSLRPHAGVWPENFTEEQKQADYDEERMDEDREYRRRAIEEGVFTIRDFEGGQMSRDMTLFVDDDGTAYHITSTEENYTLMISELDETYTDFTGRWIRVFPGGHNEAPAIFKKDGIYYLIMSGATGWTPNAARSAMAEDMFGPWTFLGNPARGSEEQMSSTFESQSTFILPVEGIEDAFIFMGDRWRPQNAIDGRYVWLPIEFEDGRPVIRWYEEWDLSVFE